MAQNTAVIRANLPSAAGSTDFTSSGFGTPVAAIVIVCDANTTNNPQDGASLSVGFWDGTNQRVSQFALADGTADSDTYRSSNDALIAIGGSTTFSSWSASAITDGIRITLVTDATTVDRHCTVILFSGVSAKVVNVAMNQTQDATASSASLGFAPKLVFLVTSGSAAANMTQGTTALFSFGFAAINGTQRTISFAATDAAALEALVAQFSETRCARRVNGWAAELTTWGADTFTLTTRDAAIGSAELCFALALGGADLSFDCGTLTTPAATGNQIQSLTVNPTAALTTLSLLTSTTQKTDSEANAFAIGLANATNQYSHNIFGEDAAATMNTGSVSTATKLVDVDSSVAGSRTDVIDGTVSLGFNNFIINYSAVTTARKGFWLAFGPPAVSYAVPQRRHTTSDEETAKHQRRRSLPGAAAAAAATGCLIPKRRYRFPQENEDVDTPRRRRNFTSPWPVDSSFELPFWRINKDYDMPRFARSTEFELPLYEILVDWINPRAAFDYNFVLPSYEIQYGYNLPVQGIAFTMPLWEIQHGLFDLSYTNDVMLTLGFYEIEIGRFTQELLLDRFIEVGFYEVAYQYRLPFSIQPSPTLLSRYIESVGVDSQTIMGVNGLFKVDPAAHAIGSSQQVIHLTTAKIIVTSGFHNFYLDTPTPLVPGQFDYQTNDGMLKITNLTDWSLVIIIDPVSGGDDEAIPVTSEAAIHSPIISFGP